MRGYVNKPVNDKAIEQIYKMLGMCKDILSLTSLMISKFRKYKKYMADYEVEYEEGMIAEAKRFLEYVKKGGE